MSEYTDAIPIPMLVNATVDETTSDPVPLNNSRESYHSVQIATGTTSGVVKVETAPTRDFAGTWLEQMSVDLSTEPIKELRLEGVRGFVRHRISTVVAGGATPGVSSWVRRRMGS